MWPLLLFVGLLVAGYKMDQLEGRHVWIYLGCAVVLNLIALVAAIVANQPAWFGLGLLVIFMALDIILLFVVFGEYLSDIHN